MGLIIDGEFKDLIPPLNSDELSQLEENILRDGIQDPLKIWQGILVDGHNRYEIAQRRGLNFGTIEMNFNNRDDAKIWIIKNQFGRRNLSAYDRSILALKLKPVIAKQADDRMRAGIKTDNPSQKSDEGYGESSHQKRINENRTDSHIAKSAGVSRDTIRKVEKIEESATPEIKAKLKSGDISINQAYKSIKKAETIEKARANIAQQIQGNETKAFLKVADGIGFKPKEKYNLLLTDPPYSTDVENIEEFAASWLPNALNYVTDDGSAYVFIGAYPNELRAYLNIQPPKHMQLIQVLVWTYKNTLGNNPKNHYKQNWQACLFYRGIKAPPLDCPLTAEQWAVQEINAPDGRLGDRFHAWQKPAEIAERFIRHTTKRGDTVFDPFACTGTFLIAAAKLGRNAYGFEIDSENAQIAFERGCVNGWNF